MGAYDTVRFRCPNCTSEINEQTKSAMHPSFRDYPFYEVPVVVAASMHGDELECGYCKKVWFVHAQIPQFVITSLAPTRPFDTACKYCGTEDEKHDPDCDR